MFWRQDTLPDASPYSGVLAQLAPALPAQKLFPDYAAESSESESENDNLDAPRSDIELEQFGGPWFEDTNWQDAESDDETHPAVDTNKRATVKEAKDEDARWIQPFPEQRKAGAILSRCKTGFETYRELQRQAGCAPWEPFESEDEWEMAHWLMTSGLSQKKVYEYLKKVRDRIKPSFHSNRAFLQRIDALPHSPEWRCYPFRLVGDELDADGKNKEETVEMWCRDPIECVRELLGNAAFTQAYEPCRIFKRFEDGEYSNREFNEMWTADWWWEIQELLPTGATFVPIILASDKTQLTRFSGDQQAWPVYLTIGNIDKVTRYAPSSRATVLLGYIPVAKLEIFKKSRRSGEGHQLFHKCMRTMLKSLKVAGEEGVTMDCADGFNLRPINPFWAHLPYCNIFRSMTPDLLHELHNGTFGDHTVKWSTSAISGGTDEVDQRFRAMTPHPSLHHFKKGISLTIQWTGTERKNMEKVFLGVLANATNDAVVRAVRGMLDFIHYAHFETHCHESLIQLDAAWLAFHDNKYAFEDLEIREHFNISKIHKLEHYVDSIRSRGTTDGFNSEGTERLHIDLAKVAYNTSNKGGYTRQMTVWLRRQEAVHRFGTYLPGYTAPTGAGGNWVADEEDDVEDESHLPESSLETPPDSDPKESDNEGELDEVSTIFAVAKTPGFPSVTVAAIEADFMLLTSFAIWAASFKQNQSLFVSSLLIIPHSLFTSDSPSLLPKYRRWDQPAYGTQSAPLRGIIPPKPGQFDTVLVRVQPKRVNEAPTDGLCVVRVCIIFRIPDDFGKYPDPVAYVDWFKPLKQPVIGLGMHQVSLSTRMNRQNSSIIPWLFMQNAEERRSFFQICTLTGDDGNFTVRVENSGNCGYLLLRRYARKGEQVSETK
ncbi:hypothetical protein B0H16DRAFT_1466005 [Mycena metata]|uniref:Uncharacterized protein n=1 Tax=Mycena metata TaxID=1033252 RepID=A0AAD7I9B5_9AGAR|nr:hypothetical protein B0H16DRAFT_1466005 [Mycena metata]